MSSLSSPPPRSQLTPLGALPLEIRTRRLRLRPLVEDDVASLWPFVSDPAMSALMSWSAHTDRQQTLDFIRHVRGNIASNAGITWAIEIGGRAVGCVGLEGLVFQLRAWRVDRGELGYWLAPPLWGQGFVTEAARAAVEFGFGPLGLHKIVAHHVAENIASQRVIEKLGFRRTGQSDDEVWRDGRWWTAVHHELTAAEWRG